jgi:hypothetical protein
MLAKSTEDFKKFLPMENSTNFLPPQVKAYSFRSDLFHEKMIENIAKVTLNKLAHKVNNNENQQDDKAAKGKLDSKNKKVGQKENDFNKEKRNDKKLKASDLDLNNKELLIEKLEKRANCILLYIFFN